MEGDIGTIQHPPIFKSRLRKLDGAAKTERGPLPQIPSNIAYLPYYTPTLLPPPTLPCRSTSA